MPTLLDVHDLRTAFITRDGTVRAVNGVSFSLEKGKVLALLGESGCGKSVTLRSIMRLLPPRRTRITGQVLLKGIDILQLPEKALSDIRGRWVSMVFQEPTTALDPVYTVGDQITENILRHQQVTPEGARQKARELLELVQIPAPDRRLKNFPHEMSGGMKQRAMVAMALACNPDLLLADEPTTSLDVTVQAQILHLLHDLQKRLGMAVIFVTHDIGVVAEIADDVAVMYAGTIVEYGPVTEVLKHPAHPYTEGLLKATVRRGMKGQRLMNIPGQPPDLTRLPSGCPFAARCPYVMQRCEAMPGQYWVSTAHWARCFLLEAQPVRSGALSKRTDGSQGG